MLFDPILRNWSLIPGKDKRLLSSLHCTDRPDSRFHSASCRILGPFSFPGRGGGIGLGVQLTTDLHLVPKLSVCVCGAAPPLSHVYLWHCANSAKGQLSLGESVHQLGSEHGHLEKSARLSG
jgi:hypothetical protein